MRSLPTRPTVQDLIAARQSFLPASAVRATAPGPEGLLFHALCRHVRAGATVVRNVNVITAEGVRQVPIVVTSGDRRIAIVQESKGEAVATAAMLLVSGPFDAVYRVDADAMKRRVTAVAWEIARSEARLFGEPGRRILHLCGSGIQRRARAADRPRVSHLSILPTPDVRPMRFNRPAEWAEPYEEAMRAIEALQIPLFARSA